MCSVAADLPMEWSRSGDGDEELLMGEASCGGDEPVEWVQVAVVAGRARAHIISGRLSSAGLPVSLTQEAAGISVFPTMVGILGTVHIWVPKEFVGRAEAILVVEWDEEE
jgi:hypothetical protein